MADRPAATTSKKAKKKPGRKRQVAGWLVLVIGVLITGVWGASRWWWFGYAHKSWEVGILRGVASITIDGVPPSDGWHADRIPLSAELGWGWFMGFGELDFDMPALTHAGSVNLFVAGYGTWHVQSGQTLRVFSVYLWPFALASLVGGGWLVWSGRRARRRAITGLCFKCGYDLGGLSSAMACPECGASTLATRVVR